MEWIAPGGTLGGGWQNRAFGVDEMVRKKVFTGTEIFWEGRKIFRVGRNITGKK